MSDTGRDSARTEVPYSPTIRSDADPAYEKPDDDARPPRKRYNEEREESRDRKHRTSRRDSRSPVSGRRKEKPYRKDTGFKWKEKRRDEHDHGDRRRDEGLQRGYRDHYRQRSRSRSPRRHSERRDGDRERRHDHREREGKKDVKAEVRKDSKPTPAAQQQNYILVYVNDRLGTKTAIPCFPTDTIKNFKAFVASKIGRQPHEILIKRQGERPFKDILTLQDYGVSHNVQLDLEVDTGD